PSLTRRRLMALRIWPTRWSISEFASSPARAFPRGRREPSPASAARNWVTPPLSTSCCRLPEISTERTSGAAAPAVPPHPGSAHQAARLMNLRRDQQLDSDPTPTGNNRQQRFCCPGGVGAISGAVQRPEASWKGRGSPERLLERFGCAVRTR